MAVSPFRQTDQNINQNAGENIPTQQTPVTEEKIKETEVVNYTFHPSGEEVQKGKLVYTNKEKGPPWYTQIPKILVKIITFPFVLIQKILEIIIKTLNLAQSGCMTAAFIIMLLFLVLIITVLYKPAFLWNPIKTFLNNDITVATVENIPVDEVYAKINTIGTSNKSVPLSNSELTSLIRDFSLLDENLRAVSDDNGMTFYMNIDTKERPLWFRISTEKSSNKLAIKKIGFGRIDTPNEFAGFLNDTVGIIFGFVEQQVTSENYITFFESILNKSKLNDDLDLKQVEMRKDEVILYF